MKNKTVVVFTTFKLLQAFILDLLFHLPYPNVQMANSRGSKYWLNELRTFWKTRKKDARIFKVAIHLHRLTIRGPGTSRVACEKPPQGGGEGAAIQNWPDHYFGFPSI